MQGPSRQPKHDLSRLEVAVSTVDRLPQYVHVTLESLVSDERARRMRRRIVVCGKSALYLDSWLGRGDVEVFDAETWRELRGVPPEGKCLLNFERLLQGAGPLLALEDDVVFTDGWVGKLDAALASLGQRRHTPKRRQPDFILALYAARRFKLRPVAPYNPLHFYGNQALYMTAGARSKLRRFIATERLEGRLVPADIMVKRAAQAGLFDLLACNPSLCQHVGEVSSLNLRAHQSPSFRP
jgi:hypothetical protein